MESSWRFGTNTLSVSNVPAYTRRVSRVCVSIGFLSKRKSAKSRISTAAGVGRRVCMILLYPIAETLGQARMDGFQGEKIT